MYHYFHNQIKHDDKFEKNLSRLKKWLKTIFLQKNWHLFRNSHLFHVPRII